MVCGVLRLACFGRSARAERSQRLTWAMPTPLPGPDFESLLPPDDDEVAFIARGLASACADGGVLTELRAAVLGTLTESMTGVAVDFSRVESVSAQLFAEGLADRNAMFRTGLSR